MSYLDRYRAGEYEQVWADLAALGEAVRVEPLYSDALAVARETMRRVRWNIETLIPRLRDIGYEFGYGCLAKEPYRRFNFGEIAEIERECPHFRPPLPDMRERIIELETQVGTLPLSLRAWYEVVGTVNFVGKAPQRWDDLRYQGFKGAAFKTFRREHPNHTAEEFRQFKKTHPEFHQGIVAESIYLDPSAIQPIEHTPQLAEPSRDIPGKNRVPLAPDYHHKYFVSGGGPYEISAPCMAIDAQLDGEWRDTTFVDRIGL